MQLPATVVTFPAGGLAARSRVLHAEPGADGTALVVTAETPFHPLDHSWPDQPGDVGTLTVGGAALPVLDSLTAAAGDPMLVGPAIRARRDDPGVAFVVAHVVALPAGTAPAELVGAEVELAVDGARRRLLSAAHTACHVMALALNKHSRPLWRKEVRTDSLGNPDLDQLTIAESRMTPEASRDRYRLGKSVRKAGLDTAALLERPDELLGPVRDQVAAWVAAGGPVVVETPAPTLSAARVWTCALPDGTARLACGGTHLADLGELASVRIDAERAPGGDPELTVTTRPRLAG